MGGFHVVLHEILTLAVTKLKATTFPLIHVLRNDLMIDPAGEFI